MHYEGVNLLSFFVRRFCNTHNKKNETSSHPKMIRETIPQKRGRFPDIPHGKRSLQPFTLLR